MSHSTGKLTSDILRRDYDSVCNGFSYTIGNRRSGETSEPVVEGEKIMQVLFSGCDRNIKLGTQCGTCGRWFHNSYGNVKAQVADSGKWIFDEFRSERPRLLQNKLQNALLQTDDLTRKNKAIEEQLGLATPGRKVGRRAMVPGDLQAGEGLVLGDSIISNVGKECSDMKVECFPGIRT
jgi:hypothetical protein